MNIKIKRSLIFIYLCGILVCSRYASAQGYESFTRIKEKIAVLLVEHKKLKARYDFLRKDFLALKEAVEQKEQEIKDIRNQGNQVHLSRQQVKDFINNSQQRLEELRNEILLKESKNVYLTGELVDVDEKQRLRKLQLSELQIQKRALQMDLKLKDMGKKDREKTNKAPLEDLQKNLKKIQDEEQELIRTIAVIEEKRSSQPQKARVLKLENEKLEREIAEWKRKQSLKDRELAYLKDKKEFERNSVMEELIGKRTEKAVLEEELKQKELKYKALDEAARISLEQQEKERELLAEIVTMDQINQELRKQVSDLKAKIEKVKDDF